VVLDARAQDLDEEGRKDEGVEGEDGGFCKGEHGGGSWALGRGFLGYVRTSFRPEVVEGRIFDCRKYLCGGLNDGRKASRSI
jgi:hypothetical protein